MILQKEGNTDTDRKLVTEANNLASWYMSLSWRYNDGGNETFLRYAVKLKNAACYYHNII